MRTKMQRKEGEKQPRKRRLKKRTRFMLSAYSIIIIVLILFGIITQFLPEAQFNGDEIVHGSGVVKAGLQNVLMAPILGFADALNICIFIFIFGGFLAIMSTTNSIEDGIKSLVHKMKGKELWLIPILMLIFSIGGTTYGMLEETVGFYALLAATMMAAGLDPLVGAAVVLLGAGSGVLGSTINPFATGVALDALKSAGVSYNQGTVILIAAVLWITTYIIATLFVLSYAKKVKRDKGSTFLSLREQAAAEHTYGKYVKEDYEAPILEKKQKISLIIFALAFLVMIVGFIPWGDFGIHIFEGWSAFLTGRPLGEWSFLEAALWFLLVAIIIAIINRNGEQKFIKTFVAGAADMMGVALIIAVARGVSVLMSQTYLDDYIVYNASNFLATLPQIAFVPLNYLLHAAMSIPVPSSSGLMGVSAPIIGPLASNLGYSVEAATMTMVSANGLVNLITPTCGAIMGGLALAKIEYTTWFKWALKVVAVIMVVNIVVLCLFSFI